MTPNIPQAVWELVTEYQRFLRTSYRFLDEHLRRQFEEHLARTDVIVRGPYVTLARDFGDAELASDRGEAEAKLLEVKGPARYPLICRRGGCLQEGHLERHLRGGSNSLRPGPPSPVFSVS
jgi:hypothetical protein